MECRGYNEHLVLSLKQNFTDQDLKSLLIVKYYGEIKYFSRNCTVYVRSDHKSVCNSCDYWYSQLTDSNKPFLSAFSIEQFLGPDRNIEEDEITDVEQIEDEYVEEEEEHIEPAEPDPPASQELNCSICDKKFKCQESLNTHTEDHKEYIHSCSVCGKAFKRKYDAGLCEKLHDGIYRFECELCDYKTNKNYHFSRHKAKHSKQTPYKCTLCDFKCTRKDNLRQHVMKRHCNRSKSIEDIEALYPELYCPCEQELEDNE